MSLAVLGPASSLRGEVRVPGDKSISHRGILFGALAHGPSRIMGVLRAGVTDVMVASLRQLGADLEFVREDDLLILGREWRQPAGPLHCGRSASTLRMLLGALAAKPLDVTLTGSSQLRRRPMARVVDPLIEMGARIGGERAGAQPPLRVRGGRLRAIEHRMPVASGQVKTALLLAGLFAEGETRIYEPGPARDHSERLLRSLGVPLLVENGAIAVRSLERPLPYFQLHVPGDLSSAAFLMVAGAAIPGSSLRVRDVGVNPRRTGILEALEEMGASVQMGNYRLQSGEPVADVQVEAGVLRAIDVGGTQVVRMIDEIPALVVAMTQAEGESIVRDAHELRLKESNRIEALVTELRKMGARLEPTADGLRVDGPVQLHGARVLSYGDHRLAMALFVASLLAQGESHVEGLGDAHESFPGFLETWVSLGFGL